MAATFTVKQVAQILGYSTNSIYTFLKQKRIKGVRVGKGRFRIPQQEVNRLLMISKSETSNTRLSQAQAMTVPLTENIIVNDQGVPDVVYMKQHIVDLPSLFDWFIGLTAIIGGLSMFLFTRILEGYADTLLVASIPTVRIILIAAGVGFLLTDVVRNVSRVWHGIFGLAIGLVFGYLTMLAWTSQDIEAMVLYGTGILILCLSLFVQTEPFILFTIFSVAYLVLLPFGGLLFPGSATIVLARVYAFIPSGPLLILWVGIMGGIGAMLVWGYQSNRKLFWIGMSIISLLLIAVSVLYAQSLYWWRAFMVLIAGLIAATIPGWDIGASRGRSDRKLLFVMFLLIGTFVSCTAVIVRVVQASSLLYAQDELTSKIAYAKTVFEQTIEGGKLTVEHLASSQAVGEAVSKEKEQDVTTILRASYEARSVIMKYSVFNAQGDLVATYPRVATESAIGTTLTEFVSKPLMTKKTYVSPVMLVNGKEKGMVPISAPIVDSKQRSIGVVVGWVDMTSVGMKLSQLMSARRGEYVQVIDGYGRKVIAKNRLALGTSVGERDVVRKALKGERGNIVDQNSEGESSIIAFDALPILGWGISAEIPITSVMSMSHAPVITMFGLIALSLGSIVMVVIGRRIRVVSRIDSS